VSNISKIIRIIFTEDAEQEYQKLVDTVKQEHQKGAMNSENQRLLKSIDEKVERLKYAPDSGIQISRKLFPQEYLNEYGINNLWKMNLFNYWRLIYTIQGDKLEVLCVILDLIDHPTYDKKFGYRSR